MTTNPTRALASFISGLQYESIPPDQFQYVRKSVLDWLGCCLAGAREPAVRSLNEVMEQMQSAPHATVIARGRRASVLDAAMLNGAAGNVLDLDDVHPQLIGHPSSVLAPTLLSLAEWQEATGRELATAYVAGYESMVRMGLATEPQLYDRGWHATGVLGVFGACAAAARLLRLTEDQIVNALAIAASQAAGLRELFGTSSKCIHHGKAATAGILSCLWAQKGVDSAEDVVGGRFGLRTFCDPVRVQALVEDLGTRFHLAQTCFKRHAACGSVHAAIDAALQLRGQPGFLSEDIEHVDAVVHELCVSLTERNAQAGTAFAAKYSLHYSLALALLEGRADLDVYTDARVNDPAVREMARKVRMTADPQMRYVEAMPADLTMVMKGGRELRLRVDAPKGRPSNPMSWDDITGKFRRLAAPTLDTARAREVVARVEALESADIGGLLSLLATPQA